MVVFLCFFCKKNLILLKNIKLKNSHLKNQDLLKSKGKSRN
nr:MAG TPA: hypothetical protein [Caudoviricetes sp.]